MTGQSEKLLVRWMVMVTTMLAILFATVALIGCEGDTHQSFFTRPDTVSVAVDVPNVLDLGTGAFRFEACVDTLSADDLKRVQKLILAECSD